MTSARTIRGRLNRRHRRRLLADRYGGNYFPVVVWLLLLILLLAIANFGDTFWAILLSAIFALAVPTGALGADMHGRHVLASAIASVFGGSLTALGLIIDSNVVSALGGGIFIALFLVLEYNFLKDVVSQVDVTVDTIFGSVAAYLLLSFLWAYVYLILIQLDPDALIGQVNGIEANLGEMLYFSVVTQTTLGYGDIVPNSGIARAFVELEALFGQLYIAVLVAWIVGRLVSRREYSEERSVDADLSSGNGEEDDQ